MTTFHHLLNLATRAKRERWQVVERGLFLSDHEMMVRLRVPEGSEDAATADRCHPLPVVDIPASVYDRAPA